MKTTTWMLTLVTTLGAASTAFAGNSLIVTQEGRYNYAGTDQSSTRSNDVVIDQVGTVNETIVRQVSPSNGAGVFQSGQWNEVQVIQREGRATVRHRWGRVRGW